MPKYRNAAGRKRITNPNLSLSYNISKMGILTLILPKIRIKVPYVHSRSMLLGLFNNVKGCVSDSPKVVYYWRIRHRCGIESEEFAQLSPRYLNNNMGRKS
ncbi:hypothetical protein H5410_011103 [Solanum commersonii]|uniref:Uncharacterized protein n=1 Tax=Solanum commersonii TaxID=4109 RepID=A0A9J6AMN1_SOLCO|nr:hypothetical protein H5410_011103 [Solanum commersonii]